MKTKTINFVWLIVEKTNLMRVIMFKKLFTSCLISLTCLQAADSQISKYSATINEYSSETRSSVRKIEPSQDYSVSIGQNIDQKTFVKICSDLNWISQLNTEYGNKNLDSFAPLAKLTKLRYFEAIHWTKSKETPINLEPFESLTNLEEISTRILMSAINRWIFWIVLVQDWIWVVLRPIKPRYSFIITSTYFIAWSE